MIRYEDWEVRLNSWIARARRMPFEWGKHDCCLAACNAVLVMTGVDLAASFRGRYSTERGAYALLRRHAGGGLPEVAAKIAAQHGLPEILPVLAQRGDLVLAGTPAGPALGICLGEHAAVASARGWSFPRILDTSRAWRV